MNRNNFDDEFSCFRLSEENNLFFAIEDNQELDSIKMIKPYFINKEKD